MRMPFPGIKAVREGIVIAKQIIINVIIDGILFHVFTLNRLYLFCFYIFPYSVSSSIRFLQCSVYLFTVISLFSLNVSNSAYDGFNQYIHR